LENSHSLAGRMFGIMRQTSWYRVEKERKRIQIGEGVNRARQIREECIQHRKMPSSPMISRRRVPCKKKQKMTLHQACVVGNVVIVKKLLKIGQDANFQSHVGNRDSFRVHNSPALVWNHTSP
jgi:hypothetical protein